MLPDQAARVIEEFLETEITSCEPIGGGCIANASRLRTTTGDFFLKWGSGTEAATFEPEAAGLAALASAGSPLYIPRPLLARGAEDDGPGLLLMEWIESAPKPKDYWEAFGRGLAALHLQTADRYGFDQNNFIGRLPQRNTWEETWIEFFVVHRLEPQVEMARDSGRWASRWDGMIGRLIERLDALLPAEPKASIVHGDLWSGNVMVSTAGTAALIDPASYYGDREVDLAMTELFGGFDRRFYLAYREAWPLELGYEDRREIYNLYHLINHLNHFGGGYGESVERVLQRFSS